MQRIEREQSRKYAFDHRDESLLRVECGESFEIETLKPQRSPNLASWASRRTGIAGTAQTIYYLPGSWARFSSRC